MPKSKTSKPRKPSRDQPPKRLAAMAGYAGARRHRRMAVQIKTSDGMMEGTITGDPNMPQECANALLTMMKLAYEAAKRGDFDAHTVMDEGRRTQDTADTTAKL